MKVYLVEEAGGIWEDKYDFVIGICATKERAVELVSEKSLERNNVEILEIIKENPCNENCVYQVSCTDDYYDDIIISVTETDVFE